MNTLQARGLKITRQRLTRYFERLIQQASKNDSNRSKSYAIISTPRVGSGFLCKNLEGTRALGWPLEWFNELFVATFLSLQGIDQLDFQEYFSYIIRGTKTRNNVFGVKFHINQYMTWKNRGLDLLKLGFDKIYYIERQDKISQAYSLAKANKTSMWSNETEMLSGFKDGVDTEITPSEVACCLAAICGEIDFYHQHLSEFTSRMFVYEGLEVDSAVSATESILEDLNILNWNDYGNITMTRQASPSQKDNINAIKEYFIGSGSCSDTIS